MDEITADILVVGGGTGGTAAAIQAARRGAHVVLVSELPWLGGMLTSAGVCAPDGNELAAFQTGIWGEFLKELQRRQPGGLSHGWVSFFTYDPAIGAQIFADWVSALPNLQWISGQRPQEVLQVPVGSTARITGVRFDRLIVKAKLTLDGTELGDLLALAEVPHRWGWETRSQWQEHSAPVSLSDPSDALYAITQKYPVQSPTWVVIMQDYGEDAPLIENPLPEADFTDAWAGYGEAEAGIHCLNYGRLPGDRFMLNWPQQGNDYGVGLHRLIESDVDRAQYDHEAQQHSQAFAHYIQTQLGRRYGLAQDLFPQTHRSPGGAFALIPYYRESRRLIGRTTIHEGHILPVPGGQVAALPVNSAGETNAIALGNYPNDHHYPGFEMPLAPKSIGWGGRQTGTPFTIPYDALIPHSVEGLLVCEKNISVSHIANGATRLQPVVLGIGQAAGMAAALCVEQAREPRELAVKSLQIALLSDPVAPAAVIPLFNLPPEHPHWQSVQQQYLTEPETYPASGYHPFASHSSTPHRYLASPLRSSSQVTLNGQFFCKDKNRYELHQDKVKDLPDCVFLLTVRSEITETFLNISNNRTVNISGKWNPAGNWILCEQVLVL